ncbi:MAG TPA: PQQ-dependent sugar dehydrogenase, partial [Gemmatimonadales bacterium]|nr:PQQ-dependent sugar dehydrogenase [Gemmatimonadales bacterium]
SDAGPGPGPGPGPGDSAALQLVTAGLTDPVFVTAPPGDTARLFVVEQTGLIRVVRHDSLLPAPFLDLSGHIAAGGERGLLSLAFHPGYAANGHFYVYYTNPVGDIRVVRYTVSAIPEIADSTTGDTILKAFHETNDNHNGGLLLFGPDGKLYAGLGDGGAANDPPGNGQNLDTLLAKILRIDVDGGSPYAIPADNPFVGHAGERGEIWLYGLRNPWRFSFDRTTGDLYIGDVGQNLWEEVDVLSAGSPGGVNYGWNVMEGLHCFQAASCSQTGLALPVVEYGHSVGCAVTGGYVYRGSRIAALAGVYFYGDFCSGWVRSFRYAGGAATERRDWPSLSVSGGLSSFGQDASGELYITSLSGSLFRIVRHP